MDPTPDLSRSSIIRGDCLNVLKKMPDASVDAVITDPPYELSTSGTTSMMGNNINVYEDIAFMSRGFDLAVLDELVRVQKKINMHIFCSRRQIPVYLRYFVTERRCNWDLLAWHKSNPTPACGNSYLPDTEYIFFARDKGVKLLGSYHTKRKYYVTYVNRADKLAFNHPTVKPMEIVKNFVINSTQPGDVVLDPFVGSGTTAVAAHELGRVGVGIEREWDFAQTATQRLKEAMSDVGAV